MNYLLKPIEFIMEETKYDNSKSLFKDTKLKVNQSYGNLCSIIS